MTERITNEQIQLQKMKEERNNLLKGKSAQEVEAAFEKQINELTSRLDQNQQQYNAILLKLTANEKTLETLTTQQQQSQTHITEATLTIEEWLTAYPSEQIDFIRRNMLEWANRSHEWLQSERQALQSLNERIAQYNPIATEKQPALEQ